MMTPIIVFLRSVASLDLELEQIDMRTFLHGNLEEKIYMEQIEWFALKGKEHLVY